mgnify:CR=1 FL=1
MRDLLTLIVMLYRLDPRNFASPKDVFRRQQRNLRRLLTDAKAHSPFYARRFAGIDVGTCDLSALPTVSKAELMSNLDDVFTDRRVKRADIERFIADRQNLGRLFLGTYGISHTSGSQGQPALIVQHKSELIQMFAVQFMRGAKLRNRWTPHLNRLFHPARMAVMTQHAGFYPSGAAFSYLPDGIKPCVNVLKLSVFDPIETSVAQLNAFRPEFIVGYASSLDVLAREERAGRLKLKSAGCLELVTSISEPLPPDAAQALREAFGVPVSNQYAMGECMCLSCGCLETPGAHLNADLAVLEVVANHNQPVPPGTPGSKVLLTNLSNRVQPFIRYEIDDLVTMSPTPCGCGSPLPLITSITGREKDKFWIEVGGKYRELPYYVFLAGLHHELGMAEHQVLQTGKNSFVIRAVPRPGVRLSIERLKELVQHSVDVEGLGSVVTFDVEIVPQIERAASG